MSTAPEYSYTDLGVLLHEEYENYDQTLESLQEGLSEQASEDKLEINEVRDQDKWIDIPPLQDEEKLGSVSRYRVEDEFEQRAVYIFDHHDGKLIIGDSSMVACAGDLGLAPLMEDPLE